MTKKFKNISLDDETIKKLRLKSAKMQTSMAGCIRRFVNDEKLEEEKKKSAKFDFKW